MAKCIKNIKTSEIRRVKDSAAHETVKSSSEWEYCPKSEWKASRS